MADIQPLGCVHETDGDVSRTSAASSAGHGGVTDDWNGFPGGAFAGSASFSGALATGRMAVTAIATGHGRADADVSLRDTLTFSGLAAGSNIVHFELTVTGTTSWDPPPGVPIPGGFGSGSASMVITRSTNVLDSNGATFRVTDKTIARTLVLDYAVKRNAPSFDFVTHLVASIDVAQLGVGKAVGGGSTDLDHTAYLEVVLPAGERSLGSGLRNSIIYAHMQACPIPWSWPPPHRRCAATIPAHRSRGWNWHRPP